MTLDASIDDLHVCEYPPGGVSFTDAPFDATAALEDIARQAREVGAARRQWESAKADAATAKKTWEREAGTLEAMILDVDRRSRAVTEPPLPFDARTGEEVAP